MSTTRNSRTLALEQVPVWDMMPIGVRPNLGAYVRQLWKKRHFIHEEAAGKAFQKSRGTILGRLWILAEPFLNSAIYIVVFGLILHIDRGIENFIAYIFAGAILFTYLNQSLQSSSEIMHQGAALIRSFTFPRAALVFSHAEMLILNALPQYAVMLLGVMVIGDGVLPSVYWLLFPIAVILQFMFGIGLSLFVASITARIPDLKFIWRLIGNFWFFSSGVFYSVARFVNHPVLAAIMEANPGYVILTISRDLLLYHTMPSPSLWIYFAAWSIGLFLIGFIVFWHDEENYGVKNER